MQAVVLARALAISKVYFFGFWITSSSETHGVSVSVRSYLKHSGVQQELHMTRCRHRWSPPSFFRVYSLSVSVCIPSRLAFSSWISSLVNRLREVECNFSLTSKSVARAAPSTHFLRFFLSFYRFLLFEDLVQYSSGLQSVV